MLLLWSVWSVAFVIQSVGVFNEFWIPAPTAVTVVAALQALLNDSLPQYVTQAGMVWFGCAMLLVLGALYLRKRPPVLVYNPGRIAVDTA